uniref:Uncharacterized protein n=1 Tax=Romanomermis culicivorax TaxID=13658 RepID=A0A915HIS9_ROMCU
MSIAWHHTRRVPPNVRPHGILALPSKAPSQQPIFCTVSKFQSNLEWDMKLANQGTYMPKPSSPPDSISPVILHHAAPVVLFILKSGEGRRHAAPRGPIFEV